MLRTLRKHQKKIFIGICVVIVPSFIMWGGFSRRSNGPGSNLRQDQAGTVDGMDIPGWYYERTANLMTENIKARFPQDVSADVLKSYRIEQSALTYCAQRLLLAREAERRGLSVSSSRAEEEVKRLSFTTLDGDFDAEAWNSMVNDPARNAYLARLMKAQQYELLVNELMKEIGAMARVMEEEARVQYAYENGKIKIRYVPLDPADFLDPSILTDEELNEHYENNLDTYKTPERRKVKLVSKEVVLTDEELSAVLEKAEAAAERARAGEDFAELAGELSDDLFSSGNGGELGFFTMDQSVPFFEPDLTDGLEVGEISDPVKSDNGYHVIKVEEKRANEDGQEEIRARHILFRTAPSPDRVNEVRDEMTTLPQEAAEMGSLEQAAEMHGLEVQETPFFDRSGVGLEDTVDQSAVSIVARRAFSFDQEAVSNPFRDRWRFYVLLVTDKEESEQISFESAADQVRQDLAEIRARDAARQRAETLTESSTPLDQILDEAPELKEKVKTSEFFDRRDSIPEIGRAFDIQDTAFQMQPGDPASMKIFQNIAYLFELAERGPFDEDAYSQAQEELKTRLLAEKRGSLQSDFMRRITEPHLKTLQHNPDVVVIEEEQIPGI